MAQSGDPKPVDSAPDPASDHDDDLIGFASPRALEGRPWGSVTPSSAPQADELPAAESPAPYEDADLFDPAPVIRPRWAAEAPLAAGTPRLVANEPGPEPIVAAPIRIEPEPEPEPAPRPEPVRATPAWLERATGPRPVVEPEPEPVLAASVAPPVADPRLDFETPPAPPVVPPRWSPAEVRGAPARTASRDASGEIEGQAGLFTLYAFILLIVPTLGVAGAIALFVVLGRSAPTQSEALSHYIFQKRTLMIAAGVAIAGVFLMAAPFGLGVISLFSVAVWVIVRGAWGLWRLKAGLPISNPRGLWI